MKPVATQAERRKQTRTRLLEAGTAVLLDQGAAGFSTVAVAETAELSNGAVFNHFDTRLDLLAATVEFALAELREGFARSFSVVMGTSDRLFASARIFSQSSGVKT